MPKPALQLPSSSEEELICIRSAGEWRLYRDGRQVGRFDYQVDAEEAALRLAKKAAKSGHTAQILVEDREGRLHRMDAGERGRSG